MMINLEKDLIKPDGIKYPPFLLSKYSIEYYDKMISKFLKEKKEEKENLERNNDKDKFNNNKEINDKENSEKKIVLKNLY